MVFLIVFVILSVFSPVFSINCFQCNSFVDVGCASLRVNDTTSKYFRPCLQNKSPNNTMFCRKLTQAVVEVENSSRVIRTCGWIQSRKGETYCSATNTDFKTETSCQCFTDGCNLGVQLLPSTVHFVAILLISTLLLSY